MRFVATSVTMPERRTVEPVVVLCDISEYSGLGVRAVRWLGNRLAII